MKKLTTSIRTLNKEVFFTEDAEDEKILDWVEENIHDLVHFNSISELRVSRFGHSIWFQTDSDFVDIEIAIVKPIF